MMESYSMNSLVKVVAYSVLLGFLYLCLLPICAYFLGVLAGFSLLLLPLPREELKAATGIAMHFVCIDRIEANGSCVE